MRARIFCLLFVSALAGSGLLDAFWHARTLFLDPRRPSFESLDGPGGAVLGAYRENARLVHETYGDLSKVGRLLPFRRLYRERFSTDSLGYRRSAFPQAEYQAVALGDCFLQGDDDELFPIYLERATGLSIYNYGSRKATDFLADARFRKVPPRLVILERVERGIDSAWFAWFMGRSDAGLVRGRPAAERRRERLGILADIRGHSLVAEQLQWVVSTLRFRLMGKLPMAVPAFDPASGMLFFREEIQAHGAGPEARGLVPLLDSLENLDRLCRARGARLVFLPVPDKFTIYGAAAQGRKPDPDRSGEFRRRLFEGLRARDIAFVDLFPAFARLASEPANPLYYADDIRWTPLGRRIGAEEFARQAEALIGTGAAADTVQAAGSIPAANPAR